jgi:hypothetical protein
MYHPGLGRFVSRDPIGFEAGDANLYRYVGNGTVDSTDPPGLARTKVHVGDVSAAIDATLKANGGEHVVVVAPDLPNITVGESAEGHWVESFADIPAKGPRGGPIRVLELIAHSTGLALNLFGADVKHNIYGLGGVSVFSAREFGE